MVTIVRVINISKKKKIENFKTFSADGNEPNINFPSILESLSQKYTYLKNGFNCVIRKFVKNDSVWHRQFITCNLKEVKSRYLPSVIVKEPLDIRGGELQLRVIVEMTHRGQFFEYLLQFSAEYYRLDSPYGDVDVVKHR